MAEYMTIEVHVDGDSSKSKMGRGNSKVMAKSEKAQVKELNKSLNMIMGFATTSISLANSAVGSYTGNKLRQSNKQTQITMVSTALGFLVSVATQNYAGAFAIAVGTTISTIRNAVNYSINSLNSIQESSYKLAYKGNPTTSGSRFKGEKR